jgi:hypothetical protein
MGGHKLEGCGSRGASGRVEEGPILCEPLARAPLDVSAASTSTHSSKIGVVWVLVAHAMAKRTGQSSVGTWLASMLWKMWTWPWTGDEDGGLNTVNGRKLPAVSGAVRAVRAWITVLVTEPEQLPSRTTYMGVGDSPDRPIACQSVDLCVGTADRCPPQRQSWCV